MSVVQGFLVAAFLFFVGSTIGWCIEVFFRRFFSAKKWINPGFLTGPYLPLYGFGVVGLFAISLIPIKTGYGWLDSLLIVLIMGVTMTVIEYIAGLIFIKGLKIKLWDYSDRRGNIQGIICPLFTLFWFIVSAFYYFVIDPFVISWVVWFVNHIAFAFVVGVFFGVLFVDLGHSINITAKISSFAKSHNIVVSFEKLKESIKDKIEKHGEKKANFIFPFKSNRTLTQNLDSYKEEQERLENNSQSNAESNSGNE